jgi:predicted DNA-binding transcriptional regulator YafY
MKADSDILAIVGDLLRGERHSRRTIAAKTGRSLTTADRWIEHIADALPRVRREREGKTTWLAYDARQDVPSKTATVGACVAASLASIFEGSQHERNLKDARDYLLKLRRVAYGDLDRKFLFAPKGGEYALPAAREELDEAIDAILESKVLEFSYRHTNGSEEQLRVRPLTLVIYNQQFYLLARRTNESWYCYRFARMSAANVTDESFSYPSRIEFDPRAVFAPSFGIFISLDGPVEEVQVAITGLWASYAETHRWHPSQQIQKLEDGSVVVSLRVRHCPELETWVLAFGEHAAVLKPESLRTAVGKRVRLAAEAYARSGSRVARVKGAESPPIRAPGVAKASRLDSAPRRRPGGS